MENDVILTSPDVPTTEMVCIDQATYRALMLYVTNSREILETMAAMLDVQGQRIGAFSVRSFLRHTAYLQEQPPDAAGSEQ